VGAEVRGVFLYGVDKLGDNDFDCFGIEFVGESFFILLGVKGFEEEDHQEVGFSYGACHRYPFKHLCVFILCLVEVR